MLVKCNKLFLLEISSEKARVSDITCKVFLAVVHISSLAGLMMLMLYLGNANLYSLREIQLTRVTCWSCLFLVM
jgi:hypothetical protein